MKKSILNLGRAINKAEQKTISGGMKEIDVKPRPIVNITCFNDPLCGSCSGKCIPCYYDGQPGYKCVGGNLVW